MDGILIVNKPSGYSSHDIVNIVRRTFNIKKAGHAGTLDPMATGILIMLIGKATKLSLKFSNDDKEYIAVLTLGKSTDTQDSTGRVIESALINSLDIEAVRNALNSFRGEIEQIPPMVSAKKYKGEKLYKLARKGKTIDRKPCSIKIHEIELIDFNKPDIKFRVKCSKGTYVRTLCEDIGKTLGYPAHMSALIRTRSGGFLLKEACELKDIHEKHIKPV